MLAIPPARSRSSQPRPRSSTLPMWAWPRISLITMSSTPCLRSKVAEVVKEDAAKAGLAEERGKGTGEVGRVDRPALRSGEGVPAGLSLGVCCPAYVLLPVVMALQRLAAAGRESDAALSGMCLGGQRGQPASAGALQGSADCGGSRAKVVQPMSARGGGLPHRRRVDGVWFASEAGSLGRFEPAAAGGSVLSYHVCA